MNAQISTLPKSILFICLSLLMCVSVFAQTQIQNRDSVKNGIDIKKNKIDAHSFNRGHITDPLQLIQGLDPSLLITRGGNDPNGRFDMRIRGINSFNITEPLILLNGMPVNSLDGIHPNDIASVEVLKGGADIAKYGMRGSNGILSIKTKEGIQGETQINYQGYVATERMLNKPQLLSADSYVNNGGWDWAGDTDWWKEISQNARSHSHHLSLSSGTEKSRYYASVNYDDVEGVIRNTGFKRVNGHFSFEQKALNNRLIINGGLAGSARQSTYILPNVLQQATSHNPTAPIYDDGPNAEKYGGYFESELFKIYNPVALLMTNDLNSGYQNLVFNLKTELTLTSNISAFAHYSQQSHSWENNIYFARTSRYINGGRSTRGYASKSTIKRNNRYFNTGINFQKAWNDFAIKGALSYYYQDMGTQGLSAGARDILTDAFSYNNLSALADFQRGLGDIESDKTRHEMAGYNGYLNLNYDDKYNLSASISRDGSSRLGVNNKWGVFYGLNAGAKLSKNLRVRTSFSKTGNVPSRGGLSQTLYEFTSPISTYSISGLASSASIGTFYNGQFGELSQKTQDANPDLQWEETNEWSLGIDFSMFDQKLNGSVDFYTYHSDQLIMHEREWVGYASFGYDNVYKNVGELKGSGLEFSLQYEMIEKPNFSWNWGFVGARYFETILVEYNLDESDEFELRGRLGGICPFPVFRLQEGQPLGEIYGLTLHPTNPVNDGRWNIVDIDNDGVVDDTKDKSLIGNGMPKFYLGMNHSIKWKMWSIDMQLRGIFGHDMVNHLQSFNTSPSLINTFNILESGLSELRGLTDYPDFTNRDVQKASYLRMANFTLGYELPTASLKGFSQINMYMSVQNLFTLTAYKGFDPELRMEDRNNNFFSYTPTPQTDTGDPLVTGMERVDAYPATRGFVFGIKIGL